MDSTESLSHSKWECKYHVIFIPKCRRKAIYEKLRPHLGEVFRKLAEQKESRVLEGHLMADHVHMLISIPPKYAVSQVIGFIKGKSAIHLARVYGERKRNFVGQHFWRGDSGYRRWGGMRQWSATISGTRRRRTSDWSRCCLGEVSHRMVAKQDSGPRQRPRLPL